MKATTKEILSALANAGKGEVAGLPLSWDLYSKESVLAAAAAFSGYCSVEHATEEGRESLSISVHPGAAPNLEVIGAFLNFLLDHSLQAHWQKAQPHD